MMLIVECNKRTDGMNKKKQASECWRKTALVTSAQPGASTDIPEIEHFSPGLGPLEGFHSPTEMGYVRGETLSLMLSE